MFNEDCGRNTGQAGIIQTYVQRTCSNNATKQRYLLDLFQVVSSVLVGHVGGTDV